MEMSHSFTLWLISLTKENHWAAVPVVPKSFRYAQSHRSGKPPSDEGGGFAVRRSRRERNRMGNTLSPSHTIRMTAPSSEGALRVCLTASAVVEQNTQAKENPTSL